MTNQSETDSERLLGLDLSRRATRELRDLMRAPARKNESLEAAKQLQQIEERRVSLLHSFRPMGRTQVTRTGTSGLRVQLSAILGLPPRSGGRNLPDGPGISTRTMSDHRMRLRRAICFAADWLPLALLLACAALLWSFQPYAQILHSARNLTFAPNAWQALHLRTIYPQLGLFGRWKSLLPPLPLLASVHLRTRGLGSFHSCARSAPSETRLNEIPPAVICRACRHRHRNSWLDLVLSRAGHPKKTSAAQKPTGVRVDHPHRRCDRICLRGG